MDTREAAAFGPREQPKVTTCLFTDIAGSSRLWEEQPDRMRMALARHDAIARATVDQHHGELVKSTGDGIYAAFGNPLEALACAVELQCNLADPGATAGVALPVRCGLHAGVVDHRDNDYFGGAVNRASRIMNAAHGGQILVSQALVDLIGERLPSAVSLRDLGTVRLRDLAVPEHVYQVLHPQLRQDFPVLRALESTPNNLPQQMTSFVGRERELAQARRLLGGSRLVTLQGAGGIGKTRLALQLAAEIIDDYPDGVWLVELAAVTDPRMVTNALASVLTLKESEGHSVLEVLLDFVRDKRLLIVLDNCEHLVQACADLAKQLLQAGPTIRLLASSRERLQIAGEMAYAVPPLGVPQPDVPASPDALESFEAVRLFVDRATAAQPTFHVTEQNASAVASICRRLDGIPLALELAAARVRSLSAQQIAARLDDRFRLLTSGDRTAMPRQQTLRALIDWSYDLLSPPERTVLGRLAVCAGGWTLEAAESIAAGGDVAPGEVLNLLGLLVDKSLVVLDAAGERFHFLETVQQYAHDRLKESGEQDEVRTRHLRYYLALAETARPALTGGEQASWLRRLDLERENLLAAHTWCDHAAQGAELGLRLVSATRKYWMLRGLLGLGHRVTGEALARPGAQERTRARCAALFDIGQIGCWMGRYGDAKTALEESLAIARELGDKYAIAVVLQPLAMACSGERDVDSARRYLGQALVLARELGNKHEEAAALIALAQVHREQGELEGAEPLYRDAILLARGLGDPQIVAVGVLNLAMVSIGRHHADDARVLLEEALAIAEETGSKPTGQSALEVCAGLAASLGDWQRAAELYGAAEAQMAHTGLHRDPTDDAFIAPLIARTRDAIGETEFAAARAAGSRLGFEQAIGRARASLSARPHPASAPASSAT